MRSRDCDSPRVCDARQPGSNGCVLTPVGVRTSGCGAAASGSIAGVRGSRLGTMQSVNGGLGPGGAAAPAATMESRNGTNPGPPRTIEQPGDANGNSDGEAMDAGTGPETAATTNGPRSAKPTWKRATAWWPCSATRSTRGRAVATRKTAGGTAFSSRSSGWRRPNAGTRPCFQHCGNMGSTADRRAARAHAGAGLASPRSN